MNLSVKHDLVNAKSKHYLFKSKMWDYIEGTNDVPEDILLDYSSSLLGKWINNVGKVKYAEFEEVQILDLTHQRIHQKAQEIIQLMQMGNHVQAQAKMEDIDDIGDEIVGCIETLEAKFS
jgi:methyl-accepting chemotaxis protein